MYRLISGWLKKADSKLLPIRRVLLSPSSFIEYPDAPGDVDIVDRRAAREWYEKMKRQNSPLKYVQLKTAEHLLDRCQTKAFER
jgi:hypothetical protein